MKRESKLTAFQIQDSGSKINKSMVPLRIKETLSKKGKTYQADKRITNFQVIPKYVIDFSKDNSGNFSTSEP